MGMSRFPYVSELAQARDNLRHGDIPWQRGFLLQQLRRITSKQLIPLWTSTAQESPHLSDRSKNVGEERLLLQHLGEAMHQWAQPVITHGGQ